MGEAGKERWQRQEGCRDSPTALILLKTEMVVARVKGWAAGRTWETGKEGVGDRYNPAHRNLSGWDLFLFCEGV